MPHFCTDIVVHIGMYAFDFLISMSYTVSSCTFLSSTLVIRSVANTDGFLLIVLLVT